MKNKKFNLIFGVLMVVLLGGSVLSFSTYVSNPVSYFNGSVGIGTNNPDGELHVDQPSGNTTARITSRLGTTGDLVKLFIGYWDGASVYQGLDIYRKNGDSAVYFNNTQGGNLIFENSNVGIGTTSPSNKLDVVGDVNITGDVYTAKWQDYGGTSTITGWVSYTTKLIYYKKVGDIVYVQYYIDGTSNSASAWFSLPYTQSNIVGLSMNSQVRAMNNGGWVTAGIATMVPNSANVEFWTNSGAAGWATGGQKIIIGQFWYRT